MVANALLLALAFLLAIAFYLMGELKFLVPYRAFLFHEYAWVLSIFIGTLFLNFFAGTFVLIRKFLLKDTGRKLSHIDKQFHIHHADLPEQFEEEEEKN
jgi:ABC-type sugar transport system permease subunit